MAHMVKSTFLMLVANFVHSPSSLRSGEAPALLDVSSIAGVDATSVVEVGAVVVPAAIYTSIWLWHGGTVSDLRAYEKEELYNGRWTELYPFIDFNYTVGSNITFHCLDPVNLTGTVVALHADATYTVHFGDGTNLTGVREACFAAAPAAAKASTVLAATSMGSCADTVELKVEDMSTGNCFVYSCRKTMPLTEVWESLGSAVGDCPSKLRILNEEGCLMRPRLSPEDQDLGSSATLYCYREQSGGGGSTEVLPSADVPEGEKPLKAKAKARKVGQLNLREEDVVMKTVHELKTDVRLPDGFTRRNNHVWTTSLDEGAEEAVCDARSEGRRLTVPAGGVVRVVKDHRSPDKSTCICAIRPSRTASSQLMRDLSAAIDEKGENFAKGILCALSENDGTWTDVRRPRAGAGRFVYPSAFPHIHSAETSPRLGGAIGAWLWKREEIIRRRRTARPS